MSKTVFISISTILFGLALVPLFVAFEAHIVNVTARIENALTVPVESIGFGTVFPQEQLNRTFNVRLSDSFLAEGRVDDVEYVIRQKPKCWNGDEQNPSFGIVREDNQGNFICEGNGFTIMPLLCPYLSKHELTTDGAEQENDTGINAFHGDPNNWTLATTLSTQVTGRLVKSSQDVLDTWNIDLRVPCFRDHCAQDWNTFVLNAQGDMDDKASPLIFKLNANLEHKLFGCDLWFEVVGISKAEERLPSIVQDNFNSYSDGSIVGQGNWTSYVNGSNYLIQGNTVLEGSKALYNNASADSVVTKAGSSLSNGRQTIYVRSENRSQWGAYPDGNAQVRISKGQSFASNIFVAVSFKSDGNVAYYDPIVDVYQNFGAYQDNTWTRLDIEWRSSDKTARYKVNGGIWTAWLTFKNAALFSDFDNVGFDFISPNGSGGVYFDNLQ